MSRHQITLPEIIEYDRNCVKVILRPTGTEKVNHFKFDDDVKALLDRFRLGSRFAGVETHTDLEAYVRGERDNYVTYAVNFFDEVSANRFRLIVNNISGFPYVVDDSSNFVALADYIRIRQS